MGGEAGTPAAWLGCSRSALGAAQPLCIICCRAYLLYGVLSVAGHTCRRCFCLSATCVWLGGRRRLPQRPGRPCFQGQDLLQREDYSSSYSFRFTRLLSLLSALGMSECGVVWSGRVISVWCLILLGSVSGGSVDMRGVRNLWWVLACTAWTGQPGLEEQLADC